MTSTRDVFFAPLTLLYIILIEQENSVDDDFTEDVRNFVMSNFQINI